MAARRREQPRSRTPGPRGDSTPRAGAPAVTVSSSTEELLLAALERGDGSLETGRYLVTYPEGAAEAGIESLRAMGLRLADARDFDAQAMTPEDAGDAEALMFPEIGVALVSGPVMEDRGLMAQAEAGPEGPIVEPETFMFALSSEYLRGFASAANTIARDLGRVGGVTEFEEEVGPEVLGATWGLRACRVPPSTRSGLAIRAAVLGTGLDLRHPDFAAPARTAQTVV